MLHYIRDQKLMTIFASQPPVVNSELRSIVKKLCIFTIQPNKNNLHGHKFRPEITQKRGITQYMHKFKATTTLLMQKLQ